MFTQTRLIEGLVPLTPPGERHRLLRYSHMEPELKPNLPMAERASSVEYSMEYPKRVRRTEALSIGCSVPLSLDGMNPIRYYSTPNEKREVAPNPLYRRGYSSLPDDAEDELVRRVEAGLMGVDSRMEKLFERTVKKYIGQPSSIDLLRNMAGELELKLAEQGLIYKSERLVSWVNPEDPGRIHFRIELR